MSDVYNVGVVELTAQIDLTTIPQQHRRVQAEFKKLGPLVPKVDFTQIHELNRLYDTKIAHHRLAQRELAKPLVVAVNATQLQNAIALTKQLTSELKGIPNAAAGVGTGDIRSAITLAKELRREMTRIPKADAIVGTAAIDGGIAKVRQLQSELKTLQRSSANLSVSANVQHTVDGSRAAQEISKAFERSSEVIQRSIERSFKSMMPKRGGGLLGGVKAIASLPFRLPARIAQDALTGVGYDLGRRVTSGISAPLDEALGQFGGKAERFARQRANRYAVYASRATGFRNTREARDAVGKAASAFDFVYDPGRQSQAIRQAEKRVSKAAQDAATGKATFMEALAQQYEAEVQKLKDIAFGALGQATQPGRNVAGIGLRINKDVQIAKQAQRIDEFASQVKIDPKVVEQANKRGSLTIVAPGLQGANGLGADFLAPQLQQFAPKSYVIPGRNYDLDNDNRRYRRLQKAYDRTLGQYVPMDIEGRIQQQEKSIPIVGTAAKFFENQLFGSNDALKQAALAKAYKDAGVTGPVNFAGYSAGTADAYEATRIAQAVGIDAAGFGVGGILSGLGARPIRNFTQFQGGRDWTTLANRGDFATLQKYNKPGQNGILDFALEYLPAPFLSRAAPGAMTGTLLNPTGGMGHGFPEYMSDPFVQNRLNRGRGFAPNYAFQGRKGGVGLRAEADAREMYSPNFAGQLPYEFKDKFPTEKLIEGMEVAQKKSKLVKGRLKEEFDIIAEQFETTLAAMNAESPEEYQDLANTHRELAERRSQLLKDQPIVTPGYSVINQGPGLKPTEFAPKNYQVLTPDTAIAPNTRFPEPTKFEIVQREAEKIAVPLVEFAGGIVEAGAKTREFTDAIVEAGRFVRRIEDKVTGGKAAEIRAGAVDRLKNNWGVEVSPYRPIEGGNAGPLTKAGNVARGVYGGLQRAEQMAFDTAGLVLPGWVPPTAKKAIQYGGAFTAANALLPGVGGAILHGGGALGGAAGTAAGGALTGWLGGALPGWAAGALGTGATTALTGAGSAIGAGGAGLLAARGAINVTGKIADAVIPGDTAAALPPGIQRQLDQAGGKIRETVFKQIAAGTQTDAPQVAAVSRSGFVNRFQAFKLNTREGVRELEERKALVSQKVTGITRIQPTEGQDLKSYIENLTKGIFEAQTLKTGAEIQKRELGRDIKVLAATDPDFSAAAANRQLGAIGKHGAKADDFLRLVKAQVKGDKVGEYIRQAIEQGADPEEMAALGAELAKVYHLAFKDELEIRSPSRKFLAYMANVMDAITGGADPNKASEAGEGLGKKLQEGFEGATEELKEDIEQSGILDSILNAFSVGGGGLSGLIQGSGIAQLAQKSAFVGGGLGLGAIALPKIIATGNAFATVAEQQNRVTRGLTAVVGSGATDYYRELAKQSNELGVSLEASAEAAVGIEASFRNTSLEGQGLSVLEGFQTSIRDYGIGGTAQESIFYGISKSARQGKIQLDEFNLVVENLPGALQALADAYGVSTAQIYQMISAGEILSEDALPKLSQQLASQSGLAGSGNSATASFTKLQNQVQQTQAILGQDPLQVKKIGADILASGFAQITKEGSLLAPVLRTIAAGLSVGIAGGAIVAGGALLKMVIATKAGAVALTALGGATPIILALTAAVTLGAAAWNAHQASMDAIKPPDGLLEAEKGLDNILKKLKAIKGEAKEVNQRETATPLGFGLEGQVSSQKDIQREFERQERARAREQSKSFEGRLNDFTKIEADILGSLKESTAETEKREELEAQILELRSQQVSAATRGEADEARELQKKVTEIQREQNELSSGGTLSVRVSSASKAYEDLLEVQKQASELIESGSKGQRESAQEYIDQINAAVDRAKELKDTLTKISGIEPTNFKKINFELERSVSRIDRLRVQQETQASQRRASIIGSAGLGSVSEQNLSRGLAQENIRSLREQQVLDRQQLSKIQANLDKIKPESLELFTQILSDLGTNLDEASGADIQRGIEALSQQNKALPDDAVAILSKAGQRNDLKQRIVQSGEQITQAQRDLKRSALDTANAQTDYLRQITQTNREITRSIEQNQLQLSRQANDVRQINNDLVIEYSNLARTSNIKTSIRATAGTFASTIETSLIDFFNLINNEVKTALDTRASNRAIDRAIQDLSIQQEDFERGILSQQQGLADIQADRVGTARTFLNSLGPITLPGSQNYGVSRDGGARRHAGQDYDISGDVDVFAGVSGVVTRRGHDPGGYGHYIDIYNQQLGIVERIAEAAQVFVNEGDRIIAGQKIGQGESETGVIHREIRSDVDSRGVAGFGFNGTQDPDSFYRSYAPDIFSKIASATESRGTGQVRMTDTGTVGANGLKLFKVEVIDGHGAVISSQLAYSGKAGKQVLETSAQGVPGSEKPIPEGRYRLGELETDPNGFRTPSGQNLGPDWLGLEKTAGNRDAFGFHLDVDGIPGSAGCIVFTDPAAVRRVSEAVASAGASELIVDYGLGTVAGGQVNRDASQSAINITRLRQSIIGNESAGDFRAVNPHSGALGYGQLMPENVAPWTRQALGRSLSASEFLNKPDAQIKTIDFKLREYAERALQESGGNQGEAIRRVASTWYSGDSRKFNDTTPQFYDGASYPSIAEYTQDILNRYQSTASSQPLITADTSAKQSEIVALSRKQQELNEKRQRALDLTSSEDARRVLENLNIATIQQRQQRRAQAETQTQASDLRVLQQFPQSQIVGGLAQRQQAINQRGNEVRDLEAEQSLLIRDYDELGRVLDELNERQAKVPEHLRAGYNESIASIAELRDETQKLISANGLAIESIAGTDTLRVIEQQLERSFQQRGQEARGAIAGTQGLLNDLDPFGRAALEQQINATSQQFQQQRVQAENQRIDILEDVAALNAWADRQEALDPVFAQKLRDEAIKLHEAAGELKQASDALTPEAEGRLLDVQRSRGAFEQTRQRQRIPDETYGINTDILRAQTSRYERKYDIRGNAQIGIEADVLQRELQFQRRKEELEQEINELQTLRNPLNEIETDDSIANIEELIDALRRQKDVLNQVSQETIPTFDKAAREGLAEAGGGAVRSFFSTLKESGDILKSLGSAIDSFFESVLNTAVNLLAQEAVKGLFGLLSPNQQAPSAQNAGGGVGNQLLGLALNVGTQIATGHNGLYVENFARGGSPLELGLSVMDAMRREKLASGRDGIPIVAHAGEGILNRSAMANIGGRHGLDALNRGMFTIPTFDIGGTVEPIQRPTDTSTIAPDFSKFKRGASSGARVATGGDRKMQVEWKQVGNEQMVSREQFERAMDQMTQDIPYIVAEKSRRNIGYQRQIGRG